VDTAPKAGGCFLGGTREIFGAVSEDLLGGTGKAEDAKLPGAGIGPSSAQKNALQKKAGLLNWEDRCGIGRDTRAGKAEQKKPVASRSPQVPQWCWIRVAPATVSAGWPWQLRSVSAVRSA
jgi:hypothetical protein